jgi:dTDP-glucose pyrophosphorylase
MDEWQKTLIEPDSSIRNVLLAMGKHRKQIALIVDEKRHLLGTLTDGDVRRSMLREVATDRPVSEIMNLKPVTANQEMGRDQKIKIMTEYEIHHIPLLNPDNQVVGVDHIETLLGSPAPNKQNRVVILAGGKGQRLQPLTETMPKPLLPLGGRPILETLIHQLSAHGFNKYYLSVNHLAELVKNYFGAGEKWDVEIEYLEEDMPLGTAGPLGLVPEKLAEPILVVNGDVITNVDFSGLLDYHKENGASFTIATREYEMEVPFGVLEMDEHQIYSITEKPVEKFSVSAGIYVVSPEVVAMVTADQCLDMPNLLTLVIESGLKAVGFPIHEYWLDVGRKEDLHKAEIDYSEIFL